jgi:hypothetical protein
MFGPGNANNTGAGAPGSNITTAFAATGSFMPSGMKRGSVGGN